MKHIVISSMLIIAAVVLFISCNKTKLEDFNLAPIDLTEYVNPMVGTDVHGHTFPGAVMPFGMVQLSPDTRLDGWDGCSAYHYSDSVIYGFSHTHLSGTGCSDYGDVLLMPMCGQYSLDNKVDPLSSKNPVAYSSAFSHESEIAKPGYYAVNLIDDDIDVELTVSPRVGLHKYKFNKQGKRYVILDLEHRDVVLEAGLRKVSETMYSGIRRSRAWADNQHLYFAIEFSQPVKVVDPVCNWELDTLLSNERNVYAFEILNDTISEVLLKVSISQVNEDGAINNLKTEIPDWNFEQVCENAKKAWNAQLNKIIVKGGSEEQRKIFYTAMYHSFIQPTLAQDVDGRYRGTDLNVHSSSDFTYYTVFSMWDTYRAANPLYTITQQEKTLDFVKTFLAQYSQGGKLPMWELSSNYTGCMIGYHSVPPIVDAYQKGIRAKDLDDLALKAMISAATANELGKPAYAEYGFIPIEAEHESVSKTLEYGFDDWCIAQYAKKIGNDDVYRDYLIRSQAYKHILNQETGFMTPRQNGAWKDQFDAKEVDFNFTEANSWQYSFYVPHDILGFINLMGGEKKFEDKLDDLFSTSSETYGKDQKDISGMIGQYAHGNEPSHHIAYLYNYCRQPSKTQKLVRRIMSEMYNSSPAGVCGNEDCGQMSAWYVLSSMGFYPVNPANGIFDIGSPLFDTVQITMDDGTVCCLVAHNNSDKNIYVEKITIDGKPYDKSYFKYEDFANGKRIDFYMTDNPNSNFATNRESVYPSIVDEFNVSISPYTKTSQRTFYDSLKVELASSDSSEIFYSINGADYLKYVTPIILTETAEVRAYSKTSGLLDSKPIRAKYIKIADDRKIKLFSNYSRMYKAGGNEALIDRLRGGNDFRSGEWQGYQAQDFLAVVDLCAVKNIKSIETGFIQDVRSWIMFPKYVEYFVSADGVNYTKIANLKHNIADNDYKQQIYNFRCEPQNCKARYVKVFAKYYGLLPKWHLGAGGESHLFIDEIDIVEN